MSVLWITALIPVIFALVAVLNIDWGTRGGL